MYIVKGNKIDEEENQIVEVTEFENLEDAENHAEEELDGYTITDSETDEIIKEQEDSDTINEGTFDMMYPDRNDDDFDQDQISGEDFFKG